MSNMSNITSKDPRADLEARSAGFPRVSRGGLFYLSDPEQWMKTRLEEAMRSAAAAATRTSWGFAFDDVPKSAARGDGVAAGLAPDPRNQRLDRIGIVCTVGAVNVLVEFGLRNDPAMIEN